MRQGRRIGRVPRHLASGFKALVWHDDRMAEDVSREPPLSAKLNNHDLQQQTRIAAPSLQRQIGI